jgi:hypothetical protein
MVEAGSRAPEGTVEVASGLGEGRLFAVTSDATALELRMPLA